MAERHRLTITVTMSLYRELCERAGPRKLSQWMEDAAWRKISALSDEALTEPGDGAAPRGASPHPGIPPPPWCWSPLRPPQGMEPSEDLVDL